MSDVQVKCTYTYLQYPNPCHVEAEIEIHIESRVEDGNDDKWRVLAAPVSLCIGRHKVSWTVVSTTPPIELTRVYIPGPQPCEDFIVHKGPEIDPQTGKWTADIENARSEGEGTDGFEYCFDFKTKGSHGQLFNSSDYIHDPTIAVTPDPLEPPHRRPLPTSGRGESLEGGLVA